MKVILNKYIKTITKTNELTLLIRLFAKML